MSLHMRRACASGSAMAEGSTTPTTRVRRLKVLYAQRRDAVRPGEHTAMHVLCVSRPVSRRGCIQQHTCELYHAPAMDAPMHVPCTTMHVPARGDALDGVWVGGGVDIEVALRQAERRRAQVEAAAWGRMHWVDARVHWAAGALRARGGGGGGHPQSRESDPKASR